MRRQLTPMFDPSCLIRRFMFGGAAQGYWIYKQERPPAKIHGRFTFALLTKCGQIKIFQDLKLTGKDTPLTFFTLRTWFPPGEVGYANSLLRRGPETPRSSLFPGWACFSYFPYCCAFCPTLGYLDEAASAYSYTIGTITWSLIKFTQQV